MAHRNIPWHPGWNSYGLHYLPQYVLSGVLQILPSCYQEHWKRTDSVHQDQPNQPIDLVPKKTQLNSVEFESTHSVQESKCWLLLTTEQQTKWLRNGGYLKMSASSIGLWCVCVRWSFHWAVSPTHILIVRKLKPTSTDPTPISPRKNLYEKVDHEGRS